MTDKEVSESVLRSIESHLRDNPMRTYDCVESEDNFGDRNLLLPHQRETLFWVRCCLTSSLAR
jgi:hypothetical protein